MVAVRDRAARIPPVVDYDYDADVLYVSLGKPRPDEGEDRPSGIVLRYGIGDDLPTGVTVVGFRYFGWHNNKRRLAEVISNHLGISRDQIESAIMTATTS